jgi:hypothetical protein
VKCIELNLQDWLILKGSDDGVKHTGLLSFLDFSIVLYSRDYKTRRFGNWICFHPQVKRRRTPTQLGPIERANLNHWID